MTTEPAETTRHEDGTVSMTWRRAYPDPVEDVWAAITEPERLARWIGTWTGEARVGATVAFTMTGEVDAGGEVGDPMDVVIHVCEPPRRLTVEMPGPGGSWVLDLTVEPHPRGAVLVFAQRHVPEGMAADLDAGWRWYLDRLAASLRGAPMPSWDDYAP